VGALKSAGSIGIFAGLMLGKPLGIILFTRIGKALKICTLPSDLKWNQIAAAGFLAGIGFTMSIFITTLAYDDPVLIDNSKIAILIASAVAGVCGFIWLRRTLPAKLAH
jgi:NhaA family Na+:H+ antiporter